MSSDVALLPYLKKITRRVIGEVPYRWFSVQKRHMFHIGRLCTRRDPWILRTIRFPIEKHGEWFIRANSLDNSSIVYSLGIGVDISFDLSIIKAYQCEIFAFDPTPKSVAWIKNKDLPNKMTVVELGVAGFDGVAVFTEQADCSNPSFSYRGDAFIAPLSTQCHVKKLRSHMHMHGHSRIDLLKIDVEGAEYEVINDIANEALDIEQIVVEFHHRKPWIGPDKTRQAVDKLRKAGYDLFYISYSGEEFSFFKTR